MVYVSEENYCSYSPDSLFGVRFNYACYLHDRQYRNEVKKRKTRTQTDIDFRDKIFDIFYTNTQSLSFGVYFPKKLQNPFTRLLMKIPKFKVNNKTLIKVISPFLGFFVSRVYFKAVHYFAGGAWDE